MMKKNLLVICVLLLVPATVCMAANPSKWTREKGACLRVGAGYPTQFCIGADWHLNPFLSVGGEVTTLNEMCGVGVAADVRSYFLRSSISPFVDAKIGFGTIGKDINMNLCYSDFYAGMIGVNCRHLDVAGGFVWDEWNKYTPTLSINWHFRL